MIPKRLPSRAWLLRLMLIENAWTSSTWRGVLDLHLRVQSVWQRICASGEAWWSRPALLLLRYPLVFVVGFGLTMTFVPPGLFGWWYDTNDDVFIRFITEGVFSADRALNVFLVFSSIYLGYGLRFLNELAPGMAWYDIYQTSAILVISLAVMFAVTRLAPSRLVFLTSTLCLAALMLGLSVRHQFTLIATGLTGVGMALLISHVARPARTAARRTALHFVAAALIVAGSLVRFDSFLLAIIGCLPALSLMLIRRRTGWAWLCVTLAISIAAAAVLYSADRNTYRNDPEWAGFLEQNKARVNLTEYLRLKSNGLPSTQILEQLEAADMSQNDRDMLANFFFSSSSLFGAKKLIEVDASVSRVKPSLRDRLREISRAVQEQFRSDKPYLLIFIIIAGVCRTRRSMIEVGLLLLAAFSTMAVLAMVFKPIPFRVSHGFYFVAILAGWLRVMADQRLPNSNPGDRFQDMTRFGLTIAALIGAAWLFGSKLSEQRKSAEYWTLVTKPYARDFARLKAERVVIVGGSFPYELVFRPFEPVTAMKARDFQLTGWADQTPFRQRSIAARGGGDFLLNLCKSRDAEIVVVRPILHLFRRYLGEHFKVFPNFTSEPGFEALQVFQCELDDQSSSGR